MEATELRIGNLVWFIDAPKKDGSAKITALGHDYIDTDGGTAYYNELKPIPITEEWLLKFGFEFEFDHENSWYTLSCILNTVKFESDQSSGYTMVFITLNKSQFKVKYVHQLQNLHHALTGEELTIDKVARNNK